MLDDIKDLPSFSNEPQQFSNMTLFFGRNGLTLHIPTDAEFHMQSGISVKSVADEYAGYEKRETDRFMPLAKRQLAMIESYHKSKGAPLSYTEEKRAETLNEYARYFAMRWADNCGDTQDLSKEFCAAALALGSALQERADAGLETMTIIRSGNAAKSFMNREHN